MAYELLRGVIHPWHHDHFGHMNVRHYAPFFDDACYHMWTQAGAGLSRHAGHARRAHRDRAGDHAFVAELQAGDLIVITGTVTKIGTKSCAFLFEMRHADTGALHATYEVVEVFFDPATRGSTAMPDTVRAKLEAALA